VRAQPSLNPGEQAVQRSDAGRGQVLEVDHHAAVARAVERGIDLPDQCGPARRACHQRGSARAVPLAVCRVLQHRHDQRAPQRRCQHAAHRCIVGHRQIAASVEREQRRREPIEFADVALQRLCAAIGPRGVKAHVERLIAAVRGKRGAAAEQLAQLVR
jgi:hypothetical protein